MTMLNFDASTVQPNDIIEAIPMGWYNAQIDQSEMKPTKDGQGAYLELRFSILDGQYANRKVFTRLNIRNHNTNAQEIAYKQLSSICHATGVIQVQDSQQLHARPLKIKVAVRAATGDYEATNEIKAFKNINEVVDEVRITQSAGGAPWATKAMPQPVTPAQQQTQQNSAPTQAAPAWQPPTAPQPWQQPVAQAHVQPNGAMPPWVKND